MLVYISLKILISLNIQAIPNTNKVYIGYSWDLESYFYTPKRYTYDLS